MVKSRNVTVENHQQALVGVAIALMFGLIAIATLVTLFTAEEADISINGFAVTGWLVWLVVGLILGLMAEAALSVLLAVEDVQEYLEREGEL